MKKNIRNWLEKILKSLSRHAINKAKPKIIGITGSVGKSSAKEAIYFVLNQSTKFKGKVQRSQGNLNTEIGLPLAIFNYKKEPGNVLWPFVIMDLFIKSYLLNTLKNTEIIVLEYAADKPGDIKYLTEIAKPNIAIITKICPVHIEQFGSIENIAKEKGTLAQEVTSDGAVFLNKDDKFSNKIANKSNAKILYFNDTGLKLYEEIATSVAQYLKIPREEIIIALKKYQLPAGRLTIFNGIKNSTIIDSTYNSSPEALKETLQYLKKYDKNNRKVSILGDMRELGALSKNYHQEIAKDIIKNSDFAILIGPMMQKYCKPILEENKFTFKSFANFSDAKGYIAGSIKDNDIILVKGSQNTLYLERVVEMLLKNKNDAEKLCRRGKKWDNIRNNSL